MHKENLLKLADYLESDSLKARFAMDQFDERCLGGPTTTTCGSVGCAIGHATFAVEPIGLDESWTRYSERLFHVDYLSPEWKWMFSGGWAYVDNTPEGAAKRIRWLLEKGLPTTWEDQLDGRAPLCYRETP